jgi:hypothetical protein
MEVSMDDAPFYLHLDRDYCWQWYVTNVSGKPVPVSRPYFDLAEAQQAKKVLVMPLAA